MANQPQGTESLLKNRRDRLVARRVRAISKGDQLALDKEIEAVDKLISVAKGRGEPSMSVDLNESGMKVNLKPTTITSRNKSKIVDDGRYSDITGPARNDLGQVGPSVDTPAQVSTPSPTQPLSPAGEVPQMSKEAELANAYAANVAAPAPSIPSPEDLDFSTRTALAVAGALNPQFFESVVAPQIGARNPTPGQQLALQEKAENIKSERLLQIAREGPLQQNQLEREKFDYEKARTQQELHAGFGHLAQEIMGSDGRGEGPDSLIQTLKAGAQQAAAAGLQVEANNLIRYAATLKGIREHDSDYRKSIGMPPIPSGPGDLQWFAGQAKEAKAALDDVFGRLQARASQQAIWDRFKMGRSEPGRLELDQHATNAAIIRGAQEAKRLVQQEGAGGWMDSMGASVGSLVGINTATANLKATLSDLNSLFAPDRLGANIPAGDRQILQGVLTFQTSDPVTIVNAMDTLLNFYTPYQRDMEGRWTFPSAVTAPSPAGMPAGAGEFGTIDDAILQQLLLGAQ